MRVESVARTDVGLRRGHNEDCFHVVESEHLFLVADGMGGHKSGEVAARVAVETIANFFQVTQQDDDVTWPFKFDRARDYAENRLITAIRLANLRIFESARHEPQLQGMGTTIAGAVVDGRRALIAHVGDSRGYLLRGGELTQVTEDHSLLNDYIRMKKLTAEEIEHFPHKNVIVRALGMKDSVQVDVTSFEPKHGDIILLCSDGLSGMVTDSDMMEILMRDDNLERAGTELIEAANAHGGNDNITVVLVRVVE